MTIRIQVSEQDPVAGIVAGIRAAQPDERVLFSLPRGVHLDAPAARAIRREAAILQVSAAVVTDHPGTRMALEREGISTFRDADRAERARWHRISMPGKSRRKPSPDGDVVPPHEAGPYQRSSPSGFQPVPFQRSFVRRPSQWWTTLLLILALGALLGGMIYALSIIIPAAEVVVTPASEPLQATARLSAVPDARVDLEEGVVPAQTVSVQVSGEARTKTTGRRPEPATKSRGRVTFINMTSRQINVPAGTIVSTATGNNWQYATTDTIALGPNGRANAIVEALLPGPDGNARAGTVTRVEGPLSLSVAVSNDAGFAGGTTAPQPVVLDEDKTRLQAQLFEELKKQAFEKLLERQAGGAFISPESVTYIALSPTFTPFVGEVSEDLFLSMSVQAVGLAVEQTEANKIALARLQEAMPPGTRMISDTVRFIPGAVVSQDDGSVSFTVTAEGQLLRSVDTTAIRRAVLGLSDEEATRVLADRFDLAGPPEISRGPDWLPYIIPVNLPSLPWRIRVEVDWDEAARIAMRSS
ncbi:MAG: baseplate J/gp47 family protein [Anaerolineae bacterium]|nr:baseplate J/gp47 family protein [Anaerolineae bacterium]